MQFYEDTLGLRPGKALLDKRDTIGKRETIKNDYRDV